MPPSCSVASTARITGTGSKKLPHFILSPLNFTG